MKERCPLQIEGERLARLLSFNRTSALAGTLAEMPLPRPLLGAAISAYARIFGVDLEEAELGREQYATFAEFFARALKPGLRPVDPAAEVVSPADGVVHNLGTIVNGRIAQVKGRDYSVAKLIHDPVATGRLEGGTFATVYLSPRDYHRVHAPVAGSITHCRHIPGALFSVMPLSVRHIGGLFTTNERIAVHLESELGLVVVVLVGATIVGRVTLTFSALESNRTGAVEQEERFAPARPLAKGEELGAFQLGSTVVLLTERRLSSFAAEGTKIRMGQPFFRV